MRIKSWIQDLIYSLPAFWFSFKSTNYITAQSMEVLKIVPFNKWCPMLLVITSTHIYHMSYKSHCWKLPGATKASVARETGGSIRGAAFQLRRLKPKGKFNTLSHQELSHLNLNVSSRHCPHWEKFCGPPELIVLGGCKLTPWNEKGPLLCEALQTNHWHSYYLQWFYVKEQGPILAHD